MWLLLYIFYAWRIFVGVSAHEGRFLTPLLTRNNALCSAEVVQNQKRYFCDQDFIIRCVPGWRNESSLCSTPVCAEDCNENKNQGKCLGPEICLCNLGWKGLSCNECIPRQGCVRGSCEKPGDCICHEGFHGTQCNRVIVDSSFKPIGDGVPKKFDMEKRTRSGAKRNQSQEARNNSKSSSNEEHSNNVTDVKSVETDISEILMIAPRSGYSNHNPPRMNESSSEDFTAPRREKGKSILNSTEFFNYDSTPSTLRELEEDTTTINELERNIVNSSVGENPAKTTSDENNGEEYNFFAPRFGRIDEDYYDYSQIENPQETIDESNEGKNTEEGKGNYHLPKPSFSHSNSSKRHQDEYTKAKGSKETDGLNPKHVKKSGHEDESKIQKANQKTKARRRDFMRKHLARQGSESSSSLRSKDPEAHRSAEKAAKVKEFRLKKKENRMRRNNINQTGHPLENPSAPSTTTIYPTTTTSYPLSSWESSEPMDDEKDSQESSTNLKKLGNTIETISSLKKDITSIEQQLNTTYITKLLNASISLRDLGFRHCRNRVTDVGHPYHSDDPILNSQGGFEKVSCDGSYPYYSLDGSCNSNSFPTRGMAFTPFRRVVDPIDLAESDFGHAMDFEENSFLCKKRLQVFKEQNTRYSPLVRTFASFVALDMAQCLGVIQNPKGNPSNVTKSEKCPPHFEEDTVNRITSFIDGSQVYGNTFHESSSLRTMSDGLMKVSEEEIDSFFGQLKREQSMSVDLLITLFKLEHNRLARQIKDAYKIYELTLGKQEDEVIYQESRRIVLGVLQHIIYDEFLPAVLGSNTYYQFELSSKKNTYYDRNLNPSVFSGFVTSFSHLFMDPCKTSNIEGISGESFEAGLLFQDHPHLIAIFSHLNNDHGYYVDYKRLCGIQNMTMDQDSWNNLLNVFKGNEGAIDLLSGALMEDHVHGGLVGPTFACIIAYQFHLIKAGDRRFYSHVRQGHPAHLNPSTDITLIQSLQHPKPKIKQSFKRYVEPKVYFSNPNINSIRDSYRFNYDEIDEIRTRSLSGLLCDNGKPFKIPLSPFFSVDKKWNNWIRCDSLIPFNLRTFVESSNAFLIKKK